MKQIWPNYSYSPTTNVLTLTGLNIDRDQLLLVSAPERGRIMYNFADSTVTASAFTAGANTGLTLVASTAGLTTTASLVIYYDDQLASSTVTVSSLPAISGTVTANLNLPSFAGANGAIVNTAVLIGYFDDGTGEFRKVDSAENPLPISGNVQIVAAIPAGTAQIGSVTASISGTVPISISSVTIGNTVTIAGTVTANPTGTQTIAGSVTIGAGISQIGSVTASISSFATSVTARLINPAGTAVTYAEVGTAGNPSIDVLSVQGVTAGTPLNVYPMQGTTVSNTNFTSTTASTSLVSAVTGREVLTVFNEGAGNLHISPGATATTISYQVRLSAGDYWECPAGQLSLAHSAVFATAGTARVCQVT